MSSPSSSGSPSNAATLSNSGIRVVSSTINNPALSAPSPSPSPHLQSSIFSNSLIEASTVEADESRLIKEMFSSCIDCIWDKVERNTKELNEREQQLKLKEMKFAEEKHKWEQDHSLLQQLSQTQDDRISLDVGGVVYATSRKILTKYPSSMLGTMFSGRHTLKPNKDGNYFIDRDGEVFRYILNFLRDGKVVIPDSKALEQQLYAEIDFYQLNDMLSVLQEGNSKDSTFSSMWKHSCIQLTSNILTAEHTSWHVNWATVLLRPSLKSSNPPRLYRFKIEAFDIFKSIQIGIFLEFPKTYTDTPSVAYTPEGSIEGTGKFEVLDRKKNHLNEKDIVGVLVDFVSRTVEFYVKGKKVAVVKVAGLAKVEEIYFGVSMWWKNKVSLVVDDDLSVHE